MSHYSLTNGNTPKIARGPQSSMWLGGGGEPVDNPTVLMTEDNKLFLTEDGKAIEIET